jgi:hypothetical protein
MSAVPLPVSQRKPGARRVSQIQEIRVSPAFLREMAPESEKFVAKQLRRR